MSVKINFDNEYNAIQPTLVLTTRRGQKLGALPAYNLNFQDCLNLYSSMEFDINKSDCGNGIWNKIIDLKLVWVKEWNRLFEIHTEINESDDTKKHVSCVSLGEAELSQINLYSIEINTEDDIKRDDYQPTVLYVSDNKPASLLNRITEKAPHYKINHVDNSIANIQRTFSFDNISLYDAFQEIAKEIGCLFQIDCQFNANWKIERQINVYDLETNCLDCGNRGEFTSVCPKCKSKNLLYGYGKDTSIFISADNLANEITYTTDKDSVKNCFKLVGGDDLMTATIKNCNPNGSDYIWYVTNDMKNDMSPELVKKLDDYSAQYQYYQNEHIINFNASIVLKYNKLVNKYVKYNEELKTFSGRTVGYASLMEAYYHTISFGVYLEHSMMPNPKLSSTTAQFQIDKIISFGISPVAVKSLKSCSQATVNSSILSMAKAITDSRYQIKIVSGSYNSTSHEWVGTLSATSYSNEEDTATSKQLTISINDNYEEYTRQKIDKAISRDAIKDIDAVSIIDLFNLSNSKFKAELVKYSLACLNNFYNCCQSCLDVLIEEGAADKDNWNQGSVIYNKLYVPYYTKLGYIESEIKLRESEIAIVEGTYDSMGGVKTYGLKTLLENERAKIQNELNFKEFMGKDLWLEFSAYRREDTYSNSNYISDGLDDSELFKRALDFINLAQRDIYKSSVLQHSITASLKNLLVMKEFNPILNNFEVGNWLRIRSDGQIYKLRLLSYKINYEDLSTLDIEFSDIINTKDGQTDIESILKSSMVMATSYKAVEKQAGNGNDGKNFLNDWVEKGLNVTNAKIMSVADNQTQSWDEHGMLFKRRDPIEETYEPTQLKIINSTMAITDDNWKTIKTAVGKYIYLDPSDGEYKSSYGIIGETVIGKLILGENLGIYNRANSMTFDASGLKITNGKNTFAVNPNDSSKLLALSQNINGNKNDVLWVDSNGYLHIKGDGAGIDITANNTIKGMSTQITANSNSISAEVENRISAVASLSSTITQNADSITSEVDAITNDVTVLSSKITQNANSITSEIANRESADSKLSTRISQTESAITSKVSKGEFATYIEQNSESVKIAWNSISDYIDFQSGGMSIKTGKNGTLLAKFNGSGVTLYYNNYAIIKYGQLGMLINDYNSSIMCGSIGVGHHTHANERGMVFRITNRSDYMGWSRDASGSGLYYLKLYYSDTEIGDGMPGEHVACSVPLHCLDDLDMHDHDILNSSDERLKDNIKDTSVNALDKLNQINLRSFDWIENGEHEDIGIIAQELQPIIPELVSGDEENGVLSIKLIKFIPYLIKAVQELYDLIEDTSSQFDILKIKSNLKDKLSKISSFVNKAFDDKYGIGDKQKFVKKFAPNLDALVEDLSESNENEEKGE